MGQAKNDGKKKKRSYQFLANQEYRILKKIAKKFKKLKKHQYGFF